MVNLNNTKDNTPILTEFVNILLIVVLMIVVVLYTSQNNLWGDLNHYYENAGDVLEGKFPYSDSKFEYPPFSLIFMIIPRILSWDVTSYYYACTIFTYVFFTIGLIFLIKILDKYKADRNYAFAISILILIFGNYFVIARNDVYPTVMVIISFWYYANKRYCLSFSIMAIAAMTKIFPILFIPILLVPFFIKSEWKDFFKYGLISVAVCLLIELPFIINDPQTSFDYLIYHSNRGIQIESVASGLLMVYNNYFSPGCVHVIFNYGSDNLAGPLSEFIAPLMDYLLAFVLVLFVMWMLIRIKKNKIYTDENKLNCIIALMIESILFTFITFSKVYSAQYLIWISLLLPFAMFSCFEMKYRMILLLLYVPLGLFSMINGYTYLNLGLTSLNDLPVLIVFFKNLFHVGINCVLIYMCYMVSKSNSKTEAIKVYNN